MVIGGGPIRRPDPRLGADRTRDFPTERTRRPPPSEPGRTPFARSPCVRPRARSGARCASSQGRRERTRGVARERIHVERRANLAAAFRSASPACGRPHWLTHPCGLPSPVRRADPSRRADRTRDPAPTGPGTRRRANPGVRLWFATVRLHLARRLISAAGGPALSGPGAPRELTRRSSAFRPPRCGSVRDGAGMPDTGPPATVLSKSTLNYRDSGPARSPNPRRGAGPTPRPGRIGAGRPGLERDHDPPGTEVFHRASNGQIVARSDSAWRPIPGRL